MLPKPAVRIRPYIVKASAYHEAGHAVANLALSLSVDSIWVATIRDGRGQRQVLGKNEGNRSVTAQDRADYREHVSPFWMKQDLVALAGDMVDACREMNGQPIPHGLHILQVLKMVGKARLHELLDETEEMVVDHWVDIERMAEAILATPEEHGRRTLHLPILLAHDFDRADVDSYNIGQCH